MTSSSEVSRRPAASTHTDTPEVIQEGVLHLQQSLALYHGGSLAKVQVAWRLAGAAGAPVVVALGGISASRRVFSTEAPRGWWDEVVGPGRALDTRRVRVLGIDYLGGSGETTGPAAGHSDFPSVSSFDQAELLEQVRKHLGIEQFAAIAGASYGGMVALTYGARYSAHVRHLIVISAAHRTHPMSTAWRSVQREIVRFGVSKGDGAGGLRLARALAMATYRSSSEFAQRFSSGPVQKGARFEFPVESYLLSRGDAYAQTYRAESFVCLSESIDLHRVDPASVNVPATLVAVREDLLVPLADMQELAAQLPASTQLVELSSLYGHDAFLKEVQALAPIFAPVLGERS